MNQKSNEWGSYTGRLLWAMHKAGKTNQSELARAVGVKPQSIQYLCDPQSGARGSSHTPSLARELGVEAEWLATGQGQPQHGPNVIRTQESSGPGYAVVPSTSTWSIKAHLRVLDAQGLLERFVPSPDDGRDILCWPMQSTRALDVVAVKGHALAPVIKDGQFLVLDPRPDQLEPEDIVLLTLRDGRMLLRELMVVRKDTLSVLPVLGGQVEPLPREQIEGIALLVCVAPRRWGP
ncbi:MAG: hypothetical protein EPO09_13205 [Aquabacterium sp.]|uniref:S24/S26 family peptidase n=1 Tax=Aquabacterium sp. TaxID=1872578 RepID=UPI00120D0D60|nr:S24/S26 family peptidase [Aquabacterium sp.]TAK93245.1 MAG: hypothetical protein EPO09_13205 [Aquabacterium sp.]